MDNKKAIIDSLEVLRLRDLKSGEKFSAIAYTKAIKELKKLDKINSLNDVEKVAGVGKKIKNKIQEILETGQLKAAEKAKEEFSIDVYQDLLKIYEVGPVKARELIEIHKIKSIDELKKHPELLNDLQKMGLKYYEDSQERIPREEMIMHEKKILEKMVFPFEGIIVGSYRRGLESSGDIDVLIKVPDNLSKKEIKEVFHKIIEEYKKDNYIIDIAALGEKKCMAFVKLNKGAKARRIDLLITPEKEYPYALLYFTGSDDFNVAFRKYALSKGYTLNEHIMKPKKEDVTEVHYMKSEKDIFKFLGLEYKEPKDRINETSIIIKKKLTLKNIIEIKKSKNK
jgi:DNA polymerase beta